MRYTFRARTGFATVLVSLLMVCGCASAPHGSSTGDAAGRVAHDPWEPLNRGTFAVNRTLDRATLRPVSKGYKAVVPQFARTGVGNFFSNLRTPLTIINQLLQGKGRAALSDSGRFLLNSTIGLGGLLDPATDVGLERHNEDFGQTLAVWGVPDGPFVVVPLLGPRTLRDALMIPFNLYADPLFHYDNRSVRDKLYGLQVVHVRARLLSADSLIEDSNDIYIATREAWLQNRRYLIYDGDPPEDDADFYDEYLDE